MKKFKLERLGDTYYLANKRSGKLLRVIGYVGSPESYKKAVATVQEMNT